ncbi:cytochrome B [bacterium]|nr:cytochrome B [bacterium]
MSNQDTLKVWDIPTRLFHWSLALSFLGAFVTSESERLQNIHITCGYTVLGLIAFRLLWGFVGNTYARFGNFVRGPAAVLRYLRSLLDSHPEHHIGHNPAGAVAIVLLLVLGIATGLSGWANYSEIGGHAMEEVHEFCANAMMAVVILHLAGVAVSSLLHRENLVRAMITGRKQVGKQS